jgi:plastocyanin
MRMSRRALALVGVLALAAALSAIPTGAFGLARAASTHTVTLKGHMFHPATLNINHGDSVKWLWRDGETEHNVTFHGFHSHTRASGSYTVRFSHRGTFHYYCSIHVSEGMKGKVVVH